MSTRLFGTRTSCRRASRRCAKLPRDVPSPTPARGLLHASQMSIARTKFIAASPLPVRRTADRNKCLSHSRGRRWTRDKWIVVDVGPCADAGIIPPALRAVPSQSSPLRFARMLGRTKRRSANGGGEASRHEETTRIGAQSGRISHLRHHGRAGSYLRARDLPRLIALWPHELADQSSEGSLLILSKLRRALRAERRRALADHWSYELNRHLGLMMAYKAELGPMRRAKLRPSRTEPAVARSTSAAAAPESGEGGVRPAREQPR